MRTLQGIAASPGVAIGEALVIDIEGFQILRRYVARDGVSDAIQRLDAALAAVVRDMERNCAAVTKQLGEQYGAIISARRQMVLDPRLYAEIELLIREQFHSPEHAVRKTLQRYANLFQQLSNELFAERAHDILDIERSLLRQLLGKRREQLGKLTAPVIILAHSLTPAETALLDRNYVLAFATEVGGASGHTAIVAKGMEIPAVVGLGAFVSGLSGGETLIVDGDRGRIILEPDEETIARHRYEVAQHQSRDVKLAALCQLPAQTSDGTRITISANIEFPWEVATCKDRGADGIGLYRTEFLYLGATSEPTEDDHFHAYAEVVRAMDGKPVVIRTLDLGADKMGYSPAVEPERNPFLGVRSIRLSLRNVPLFRTQLRAVLRASLLGDVQLMFPLISTVHELMQAKMVLADAMEDLEDAGIPFNRHIPVGMMVEVPSAVIILDRFLPEVSFVSIGTNDLIQYTLAVDRGNSEVADSYQPCDPAVLRLLDMTLRAAAEANVHASVCGQMSGDVANTMLLLGLGAQHLSVPPGAIPEVKQVCRSVSIPQCQEVARRALTLDSAREIDSYLREEVRKVNPQ